MPDPVRSPNVAERRSPNVAERVVSRTKLLMNSRPPRIVNVVSILCVTAIVISIVLAIIEWKFGNYLIIDQSSPFVNVVGVAILCFIVLISLNYSGLLDSHAKTLVSGLIGGEKIEKSNYLVATIFVSAAILLILDYDAKTKT
jgi:hypothetical protein